MEVKYNDDNDADMVRDKIPLRRCVSPNKVDVPDGRTFYARYETLSRKNLLAKKTMKKVRTIGLRSGCKQKQQGAGILSSIFKLGTKLFKPSNLKLVRERQTLPSEKKSSKKELNKHLQYRTLV